MEGGSAARLAFVWGLKRSGIHLVVGWLYANLGGFTKGALPTPARHHQLCDGFADPEAGVAFFNNCGRLHSRRFELGDIGAEDFAQAAQANRASIFGIEDCSLRCAPQTAVHDAVHLLVLRDPLNNLASRLRAAESRPTVFRTDNAYLDLYEAYCREALGRTDHLPSPIVVTYDRFIQDRPHRDELAARLGLANRDAIEEVSPYGGGSSFSGADASAPDALLGRYREHPVPTRLVEGLLNRAAVRDACTTLFGYDLAEQAALV